MITFLGYMFLGLSLAAPIGPVNAAQLDTGIKNGFFAAWLVGLGAITADLVYMLAVYLGVVQFLQVPFMQSFLWSFGCFVLIYTGIEGMLNAGVIEKNSVQKTSSTRAFFYGFFISISNPLTILFWLGIYGSVLVNITVDNSIYHVIFYSFAIFSGLLIWDILMAGIASSFRNILTNRALKMISVFSGISLIGFGLYFGYQAYKMLFT